MDSGVGLRKLVICLAVGVVFVVLPVAASAGTITISTPGTNGAQYSATTLPPQVEFTTSGVLSGATECRLSINGQPTAFEDCAASAYNGLPFEVSANLFDWTADYGAMLVSSNDGTWAFSVRATLDSVQTTTTRTFTVDTVAPSLGWTAPLEDDVFPVNVPSVAIAPTDPTPGTGVDTIECRYNAAAYVDCGDDSIANPNLANGGHSMSVRVTDVVGNVSEETRSFRIDTIHPVVTLDDVPSPSNNKTPNLTFTVDDVYPGTSECRVYPFDSTPPAFGPCSSADVHTPAPLADGKWVAEVRHTDEAGNQGFGIDSFIVDTVPPVITINSPLPNQVLETPIPELELSAADPAPGTGVANFQCAFDADVLTGCGDEAFANRRLGDGQHTLTTVATDNTGNTATKLVQFSVDSSLGSGEGAKPTKVTFKRLSKKVKRGKLRLRARIAVTLAPGVSPAAACRGQVRVRVVGKLRKQRARSFTKRFALKRSGAGCVATASFALPRAYKRAKLTGTASFAGNASLGSFRSTARL